MKINLIGSSSKTNKKIELEKERNKAIDNQEGAPGIEAAFPKLVPDNTILDWTLEAGKFTWHKYEAPDGSPPPSDEEIWHEYRRAFLRWLTKTQEIKLFSTPLLSSFPTVDLKAIKQDCLKLAEEQAQTEISNLGGYQGHNFSNQELHDAILNAIPPVNVNSTFDFEVEQVYCWVNINGKGDANVVHDHKGIEGHHTLWSGVFYVEVPPDSGSIVFVDPRIGLMADANHVLYDGNSAFEIIPQSGQLILFPSWLQHFVKANKKSVERISIAFNVTGTPIKRQ